MNAAIMLAALVVGGEPPPEAVPLNKAVQEYRDTKPSPKPPAAPGAPVCTDGSCAPSSAGATVVDAPRARRIIFRRGLFHRRGGCASGSCG